MIVTWNLIVEIDSNSVKRKPTKNYKRVQKRSDGSKTQEHNFGSQNDYHKKKITPNKGTAKVWQRDSRNPIG